jgi:tight adherence protein C
MNIQEFMFLALLFIAVFAMISLVLYKINAGTLRKRLSEFTTDKSFDNNDSEFISTLVRVVDPLGKLSLPSEGWEKSPLHLRFLNAGWRSDDAPKLYFGIKTLLTFSFTAIAYQFLDKSIQANNPGLALFILLFFAAFGYYLPNIVLSRVVENRTREIFESLPDATDLLIVCMEAGLSFDQALAKVASEIKVKSAVLGQELELVLMEIRSGFTRERALKNLALRTGIEEIDSLATMVIQSERFGTSIGDALRVHSDSVRTIRRQKAEETAASIAIKFLFPLIFCLMPALFIVMLGPALMQLKEAFS